MHKRMWQRAHVFLAARKRCSAQILDSMPRFCRTRGGWQWLTKSDAHRIRNMPRQLPQKSPARETEDGAPHSVEVHRNNRHVNALDDPLHPPPERQHLADARHLPFRKNADELAVLQRLRGFAQRMNHLARALIG